MGLIMRKAYLKAKNLFLYSDSEPNELLISLCHIFALPSAICIDFESPSIPLIAFGIIVGLFQAWAVLFNGTLHMRLIAVQVAALVSIATVENLFVSGLLNGSRVGWVIIMVFAIWNTVRVFKEKMDKAS